MNDRQYQRAVQSILHGRDSDADETIAAMKRENAALRQSNADLRRRATVQEQTIADQKQIIGILTRTNWSLQTACDSAAASIATLQELRRLECLEEKTR